jgi:hypothetical protein
LRFDTRWSWCRVVLWPQQPHKHAQCSHKHSCPSPCCALSPSARLTHDDDDGFCANCTAALNRPAHTKRRTCVWTCFDVLALPLSLMSCHARACPLDQHRVPSERCSRREGSRAAHHDSCHNQGERRWAAWRGCHCIPVTPTRFLCKAMQCSGDLWGMNQHRDELNKVHTPVSRAGLSGDVTLRVCSQIAGPLHPCRHPESQTHRARALLLVGPT